MNNKIGLIDYDADWALKDRNLHPRATPGYLSREEVIEFFGTLGVQGVELYHGYWDDYSSSQLKSLISNAGLTATAYLSFVDLALPPEKQQAAVDHLFSIFDRASEVGASFVHNVSIVLKDGVPLEIQRGWVIAGLRKCVARAKGSGLTLVCENLDAWPWRLLTGRAADALDLWAQVDSPSFRMMYDAGNSLFVEEDALAALRIMAPSIVYVHLKNFRPVRPDESCQRIHNLDNGKRYTGALLETGEVSIPPIIAELQRMRYKGWLTIEYQGEDDPRVALKRNVEYLRELLAGVEKT